MYAMMMMFAVAHAEEVPAPSAKALAPFHHYQYDLPLCAMMTEVGVLEAYTGEQYPLDQMLAWYVASGTFDVEAGGVPPERIGEALSVKGIPASRERLSGAKLRQYIEQGYAVMALVRAELYWAVGERDPMAPFVADLARRYRLAANHLVWVVGANDRGVFVNDTAIPDGAPIFISNERFLPAWERGGFEAIVVHSLLPPLDPDGDGKPFVDRDGDGYASIESGGRDCDDGDSGIGEASVEVPYDGVDQDCDGWDLVDIDGDGWIATEVGGDDCFDKDPSRRQLTLFRDDDSDGFGAGDGRPGCMAIRGFAVKDGDCADSDGSIHPDAVDIRDNGVDEDCDGTDPSNYVSRSQAEVDSSAPHVFRRRDLSRMQGVSSVWFVCSCGFRAPSKTEVDLHLAKLDSLEIEDGSHLILEPGEDGWYRCSCGYAATSASFVRSHMRVERGRAKRKDR